MLKSCKIFHYIQKIYSNLLSNPRGGSVALEAEQTWKPTIFKKKLKIASFVKKNC